MQCSQHIRGSHCNAEDLANLWQLSAVTDGQSTTTITYSLKIQADHEMTEMNGERRWVDLSEWIKKCIDR